MNPTCFDHCPICQRHTYQLAGKPDNGSQAQACVTFICEVCDTLLLVDEQGIVEHHVATDKH